MEDKKDMKWHKDKTQADFNIDLKYTAGKTYGIEKSMATLYLLINN